MRLLNNISSLNWQKGIVRSISGYSGGTVGAIIADPDGVGVGCKLSNTRYNYQTFQNTE